MTNVRHTRPNKKTFAAYKGCECFAQITTRNKTQTIYGIVLRSGIKANNRHYSRARVKEIFINTKI